MAFWKSWWRRSLVCWKSYFHEIGTSILSLLRKIFSEVLNSNTGDYDEKVKMLIFDDARAINDKATAIPKIVQKNNRSFLLY